DHWENFVFRIKNNLTTHKRIDNHPKYWGFKVQLANLDTQDAQDR
ncbi:15434_t:CDS:1, partial [Gigaspora margarita]